MDRLHLELWGILLLCSVPSDDWIVSVKIRLSQRRKIQTTKTTRYDLSSIPYRNRSNEYTVFIRNKFGTLLEISERHTLKDGYESFATAHIEAGADCILTKPRAKYIEACESLVVQKKRYNLQKSSFLKKRNLTNQKRTKQNIPTRTITIHSRPIKIRNLEENRQWWK